MGGPSQHRCRNGYVVHKDGGFAEDADDNTGVKIDDDIVKDVEGAEGVEQR